MYIYNIIETIQLKPLLLNIIADSKLSKKEEAEDNAPLSRLLTVGH